MPVKGKDNACWTKCQKKISNLFKWTKDIAVRAIMIIHSVLIVWRVVTVQDNHWFGFLACANVFLIIEGLLQRCYTKFRELRCFQGLLEAINCQRFSLCFFIYLVCTFPGLWLLELDRFDHFANMLKKNNASVAYDQLNEIRGISLPIKLDSDTWVLVLEQSLLAVIFVGRWLLPQGAMTYKQLSKEMMTYIGPAFDIMEILIILEEQKIREDKVFTIAIFVVWNVSFLQFTLLLPSDENQEMRKSSKSENDGCYKGKSICDNEVLGLLIHAILMDIPFFVVRMIVLVKYGLYDTLFFASKNFVVILSTVVRLIFIYREKSKNRTRSDSEGGHDCEQKLSNLIEDKNQVNTGQNNENNVLPSAHDSTNIDQSFNLNGENNNDTEQTRRNNDEFRMGKTNADNKYSSKIDGTNDTLSENTDVKNYSDLEMDVIY